MDESFWQWVSAHVPLAPLVEEVQALRSPEGEEGRLGVQEVGEAAFAARPLDAHGPAEMLPVNELDPDGFDAHTHQALRDIGQPLLLFGHIDPDHLDLVEKDQGGLAGQ